MIAEAEEAGRTTPPKLDSERKGRTEHAKSFIGSSEVNLTSETTMHQS